MKDSIKKLTQKDFITSIWSGGTTTQLFIFPENSDYNSRDFKIRLSLATVEQEESRFTKLDGIRRFLTPLDNRLKLTHNGEDFIDLNPFEIYEFDGHLETKSIGKAADFNLMLAHGTNGKLQNLKFIEKEEIHLATITGLNLLYSFNAIFIIHFKGEEMKLLPHELLVIKSQTIKQINIRSIAPSNLLIAQIAT